MNSQYRKDESTGNLTCRTCGLEKDDYVSMIRHKHYTIKEWKRLNRWAERENGTDYTFQEVLLRNYEVILTDHQTKSEKAKKILDKFTIQNLDHSMTKLTKGIDKFAKSMESSQKRTGKQTKEPDYSALFFGSTKPKKTKRSKKRTGKQPDYSFLIGKRKKTRLL